MTVNPDTGMAVRLAAFGFIDLFQFSSSLAASGIEREGETTKTRFHRDSRPVEELEERSADTCSKRTKRISVSTSGRPIADDLLCGARRSRKSSAHFSSSGRDTAAGRFKRGAEF